MFALSTSWNASKLEGGTEIAREIAPGSNIQSVVYAFPDFYVADYNEHITSDNFFIKAQSYAERDFFPGSYGKKDFLQSVFSTLVLKMEQGEYDYWRLTFLLRDLFQEKFAVAYFLDPVLLAGRETGNGWIEALSRMPTEIGNRVLALVSDGFRGLCHLAKEKSWVIQRCHFHLLAQFKVQLGFWKKCVLETKK